MARKTFCNRLNFEIIIVKKSSEIEENKISEHNFKNDSGVKKLLF